jgi:hypothetical protein
MEKLTILEPDFKIVKQSPNYVLYVLKNKKEYQEDNSDQFKIIGYYTKILPALKTAYSFRKDKKYKHKESYKDLWILYKKLKDLETNFETQINSLYNFIPNLKLKHDDVRPKRRNTHNL